MSGWHTVTHHTHTPVPEAHGPRRVAWNAVNDAQLGGLEAVLPLPTLTELHRLCRHTAEVRQRGGARRARAGASAKFVRFEEVRN